MAFYKLFCILHRRTDWPELLKMEKALMSLEWRENLARRNSKVMDSVVELSLLSVIMQGYYSKNKLEYEEWNNGD